jgi:UrcA family protein
MGDATESGEHAMNTIRNASHPGLTFAGRALAAIIFSAACLMLPIAPALAGGFKVDPPTVTVYYDPGRVEQVGYATDLHARLEDAASQVCGEVDIREGRNQGDVDRCFGKSLNRAVRDVDSPTLRAVHEGPRRGTVRIAASR